MNFGQTPPPWDLTADEKRLLQECLEDCCNFSEEEIETLMGCTLVQMEAIARQWPEKQAQLGVKEAVITGLNTLLGQPGGSEDAAWWNRVQLLRDKLCGQNPVYDLQALFCLLDREILVHYFFFWGHRPLGSVGKNCLSQWYPAPFEVEAILYPTAEHFMMAEKARLFNDLCALDKILQAGAPEEAKRLGREIRGFDEALWREKRFEILVRGNIAKFSQNRALYQFLCHTYGNILVEASPVDEIYGIGLSAADPDAVNPRKWKGLNLLGFALMKARDAISHG